jgi:hypothetical protein
MSEQISDIQSLDPKSFLSTHGGHPLGEADPAGSQIEPLFVVYYLLLQATNTGCGTALIQAKMMNENAAAQDAMNNRRHDCQSNQLPSKLMTRKPNGRTKGHMAQHGFWQVWYYKQGNIIYISVCKNQGEIDHVVDQNEEVNAKRNFLTNQLNSLQQTAQLQSAQINTIADMSMQSTQQASHILDLLTTLTDAALLRKPIS